MKKEMPKYKINQKKLFDLYMKWVEDVSEACDWKTHFGPEEIVAAISRILEENPKLIKEVESGLKGSK